VRLLSVNVGLPRDVTFGKRKMRSAILKSPVNGAIPLARLGLEGDGQADPRVHGGPAGDVIMLVSTDRQRPTVAEVYGAP
jgi:MOSC domain-containing protein YiiM